MFNLSDFPGILFARTAGDLATLLGIAHLLLPAIIVIFQGKVNFQHSLTVLVHLYLFQLCGDQYAVLSIIACPFWLISAMLLLPEMY